MYYNHKEDLATFYNNILLTKEIRSKIYINKNSYSYLFYCFGEKFNGHSTYLSVIEINGKTNYNKFKEMMESLTNLKTEEE